MKAIKLISLPVLLASSAALAEPAIYFAGMVGLSKVDTGIKSSTLTTIDDEDTAFEGILGLHVADNFSVEAHYANLGTASITTLNGGSISDGTDTINNTSGATLGISAEATSMGIGGMIHGSTDSDLIPFAKLGWHSWDLDVPVTVNGVNVATISDDGNDIFYGAGLMWKLNDNLAVRGEYTGYKFDSETVTKLGVGIAVNF